MLDNLSAHKVPPVAEWLAHPKRARWHLHFTPTSSSWLNLVERWFNELTERRLRRGVFSSVPHLVEAIELWAETLERRSEALHLAQERSGDHHQGPPRTGLAYPSQFRDPPLASPLGAATAPHAISVTCLIVQGDRGPQMRPGRNTTTSVSVN